MTTIIPELLFAELALLEPHRMAIACVLAARRGPVTFVELRELLELTDGNLNRHLFRLEQEGIVASSREKKPARHPRTSFQLTAAGRDRLRALSRALQGASADIDGAVQGARPLREAAPADSAAPASPADGIVDERFAGLD